EDESDELLLAPVGNAMILTRRRKHDLSRPELALLIAHREYAFAFENVVNLVLAVVRVRALLLTRLEAIGVAKESVGFEDAIFFHFLGRKLHGVGELLEITHG